MLLNHVKHKGIEIFVFVALMRPFILLLTIVYKSCLPLFDVCLFNLVILALEVHLQN